MTSSTLSVLPDLSWSFQDMKHHEVARLKSVDSWMIMNCASEIWKPVQVQTGQDPEDVTEVSCDVLTELVGILDQC